MNNFIETQDFCPSNCQLIRPLLPVYPHRTVMKNNDGDGEGEDLPGLLVLVKPLEVAGNDGDGEGKDQHP